MAGRILVVEDEDALADLLRIVLSDDGYTVAVAPDGAQGLMLARGWQPDLILVDLRLPAVDGQTLIAHLRADESAVGVPIIAMSAGENIRGQSHHLAGVDGILVKPFAIDALLAQVQFALDRRAGPSQSNGNL